MAGKLTSADLDKFLRCRLNGYIEYIALMLVRDGCSTWYSNFLAFWICCTSISFLSKQLQAFFISFVDAEELLKKFYVSSAKYFVRERSLAQKNVFTFHLFSSFVNNELESKCFY